MAKRQGAYRSEKRKKEITRQKKQEGKRQKRLQKDTETMQAPEPAAAGEPGEGQADQEQPGEGQTEEQQSPES